MKLNKKQISFGIIFLLHIIAFIVLFVFQLNDKYYGFESSIKINPFELEDHNGAKFTEKELNSNFHFIYFGFLRCTEICPKGVSLLTRISKKIPDSDLRFVFVSIDPERDSKESINTYMQNRDKRFIGVRDSDINKIENFAGQFYVQFARDIFGKNNSAYQINHSSNIILINKSNNMIIRYPEGLEDISRVQSDFEYFKKNNN